MIFKSRLSVERTLHSSLYTRDFLLILRLADECLAGLARDAARWVDRVSVSRVYRTRADK